MPRLPPPPQRGGLLRDQRGFGGHPHPDLMIVVAIIGILAAIAIPKFAELIRKSNEGALKGHLGAVRSALSIFYGDLEGRYPYHLATLTERGKYLSELPAAGAPDYHPKSSRVRLGLKGDRPDDAGGWFYVADPASRDFGTLLVNCTHTDTKGTAWTFY